MKRKCEVCRLHFGSCMLHGNDIARGARVRCVLSDETIRKIKSILCKICDGSHSQCVLFPQAYRNHQKSNVLI